MTTRCRVWTVTTASLTVAIVVGVTLAPGGAVSAVAQEPFSATITFGEAAFPDAPTDAGTVVAGPDGEVTASYNLFDDATGDVLDDDNGDLDDVTFIYRTSPPGDGGGPNRPDLRFRTAGAAGTQLTGRTAYVPPREEDNLGTRQWYEVEVRFADHLDVAELSLDLFSLNTSGIDWEFSEISFLDADGVPFSPRPDVAPYLDSEPGVTGNTAPGQWLAALTSTVTGVGTSQTASGISNPPADGPTIVDEAAVDVAGELLGGFVWRTTLEDVAGVQNGVTGFSSSLRAIELTGLIEPEHEESTADLSVALEADDDEPTVGDEVTVTVAVDNDGPDDTDDVEVHVELPDELAIVDDTCEVGGTTPWTWTVGTLGADTGETCALTAVAVDPGTVEVIASVEGAAIDPDPSGDTATVTIDVQPPPPPEPEPEPGEPEDPGDPDDPRDPDDPGDPDDPDEPETPGPDARDDPDDPSPSPPGSDDGASRADRTAAAALGRELPRTGAGLQGLLGLAVASSLAGIVVLRSTGGRRERT